MRIKYKINNKINMKFNAGTAATLTTVSESNKHNRLFFLKTTIVHLTIKSN